MIMNDKMTYNEFNKKWSDEYEVCLSHNGNDFTDDVWVDDEEDDNQIYETYFGRRGLFTWNNLPINFEYVEDLLSCFIGRTRAKKIILKYKQNKILFG